MVLILILVVVVIIVVWVKIWLGDRDSVGAGGTVPSPTPARTPAPAAPRSSHTPVRPPRPPGWICALDFGTTYSKASWWTPGQGPVVVPFGPYSGFRSAVGIRPDGSRVLGQEAETYRYQLSSHVELYPKKRVGEELIWLGDSPVPVVELVAAVLRKAFDAAKAEAPSGPPHEVVLTHPAAWTGTSKTAILEQAGRLAGIPHDTPITLVAEPVAAAARWGQAGTVPAAPFAVYDFGGGTLELAVVRITESGPDIDWLGRENLGGTDLDAALFHGAGAMWGKSHPDRWQRLSRLMDDDWAQARAETLESAMVAKEVLAQQPHTSLFIRTPDGGGPAEEGWDVPVSRQQFDWFIESVVRETVGALDSITRRNDLPPCTPVYLSGGSSRTKLVRTMLGAKYPLVGAGNNGDVPELTVVQGAVLMGRMHRQLWN